MVWQKPRGNSRGLHMRISVLGGGSWGTALAHHMACKGFAVRILMRNPDGASALNERRENARYLPGLILHEGITALTDPAAGLCGADVVVLAVPCQHLRATLREFGRHVPGHAVPVCASKGVEAATLKRMSEVVADMLPVQAGKYAILSGPSFAKEVVEGKPAAVVLGCADAELGERLRTLFSSSLFRVYSSTDVVGVELGGAVKNVMAIAAGLCDGLGLGHSARAALITRGLAEMSRLGVAVGAKAATFMGLSGMGDLVLTCTGDLSRNRQVGMRLGAGESMTEISGGMHMVAEGVTTTEAVCLLGDSLEVELPIARAMRRIVTDGAKPGDIVHELMTRTLREE